MKDKFFWRLTPSNNYFDELWNEATFVFDTNILLDMYRAKKDTFEEIKGVLNEISNRVWIPYCVADEYFRNRENTIEKEIASFEEAKTKLEEWAKKRKSFSSLEGMLGGVGSLIPKEIDGLYEQDQSYSEEVDRIVEQFKDKIASIEDDHLPDDKQQDKILEYLLDLFEGKVGNQYSEKELEKIYTAGEKRYNNEIPPGYADSDEKDEDYKKFGDLIIWNQIINYSRSNERPIILITSEKKSDWWQKKPNGQIISPDPILRKEFQERTNQRFWLYGLEEFLKQAKKRLDLDISDEAIEESGELSEEELSKHKNLTLTFKNYNKSKLIDNVKEYLQKSNYDKMVATNRTHYEKIDLTANYLATAPKPDLKKLLNTVSNIIILRGYLHVDDLKKALSKIDFHIETKDTVAELLSDIANISKIIPETDKKDQIQTAVKDISESKRSIISTIIGIIYLDLIHEK